MYKKSIRVQWLYWAKRQSSKMYLVQELDPIKHILKIALAQRFIHHC